MALSMLQAVTTFLTAAKTHIGNDDGWASTVDTQVQSVLNFVTKSSITMDDASEALNFLNTPLAVAVFDAAQRKLVSAALAKSISNNQQLAVADNTPVATARACTQTHFYLYNYLVDQDWTILLDRGALMSTKIHSIIDRSFAIGLVNPNEKSMVSIVAILAACGAPVSSNGAAFELLEQVKRLWKMERNSRRPPQTCLIFPPTAEDIACCWILLSLFPFADYLLKTFFPIVVSLTCICSRRRVQSLQEFMSAHHSKYADDALPVDPPISRSVVEDLRSSFAARKTHKSLASSSSLVALSQPSSSPNCAQQWMAAGAAFMKQMMSGSDDIHIDYNPQRPPSRSSSRQGRALDDHPARDQTPPPRQPPPLTNTPSIATPASVASASKTTPDANASEDHSYVDGAGLDSMVGDMALPLMKKKQKVPAAEDDDNEQDDGDHGAGECEPTKPRKPGPKAKGKGKAKAAPKRAAVAAAKATGKAKAAPKAKPASKVVASSSRGSSASRPSDTTSKANASAPKKANARPHTTVEWSRSHVLARTGLKGQGQSKTFPYENKDPERAQKLARKWLKTRCDELGIPHDLS